MKKIIFNLLLPLIFSILVGVIGTFMHRFMSNWYLPVGLIIMLLTSFCASWVIRSFTKTALTSLTYSIFIGIIVFYFASTIGPGRSYLIISSLPGETLLGGQVGQIWVLGASLAGILPMFFPKKWFYLKSVDLLPVPTSEKESKNFST